MWNILAHIVSMKICSGVSREKYVYIYIHIVNFVIENYYRNFCFSHVHAISKILNLSFYNTIS